MIVNGALPFLVLCCSLFHLTSGQAVIVPSNIEAKMKVIYTNTSTNTSIASIYTFTFAYDSFTTIPSFAYGINDFQIITNFTHVYFLTQTVNLTSKSVGIMLTIDNATRITKFSISYISIWN
jgi:hypothetical protein